MGCSCDRTQVDNNTYKILIFKKSSYRIINELGKGGSGKVQKLQKDKNYYALKTINIEKLEEKNINYCKEEIETLKSFDSKYITKFYDSQKEEKNFKILMEYGGDTNLKTFIERHREKHELIEEKEITNILIQICEGVKVIHNSKIIHKDLTPDNILYNENKIKITDFGISINLLTNNEYKNDNFGKFKYMAPEALNENNFGFYSDIYSLGCIAYELFTLDQYYVDVMNNRIQLKNSDIFRKEWQILIDKLLHNDYKERPSIEDVINYIKKNIYKEKKEKDKDNEIKLEVKIDEEDIGKQIFFLSEKFTNRINKFMKISVNNNKQKENKNYFNPDKTGIYIIKINFCFPKDSPIKNCANMFSNCKNLIVIDLSHFNTKEVANMDYMFSDCINLTRIDFSNFNTENVVNMAYMFYNCINLANVDFSYFKTKKVTNIEYMFYHCANLKCIDLSFFNTENVINMENVFSKCENLETIILSSIKTEKVTNMKSMFNECKKLKNIDLSSFNTKNVTNMESMFSHCWALDDINLSSFNTEKVTTMALMFNYCSKLKKIDLSSFDIKEECNLDRIFCCNQFEEIIIKKSTKNIFVKKFKDLKKKFNCKDES